jgi:hypothetical protein
LLCHNPCGRTAKARRKEDIALGGVNEDGKKNNATTWY